jgi:hypothetical protein
MMCVSLSLYIFVDFKPFYICHRIFACRRLLAALAPLIGAESALGDKAVGPGWAHGTSDEKIREWTKKGTESVKDEMDVLVQEACSVAYGRLMRKVHCGVALSSFHGLFTLTCVATRTTETR